MTRQLEQVREQRQAKFDKRLVVCIEYGLVGAIGHAGGELHGFAVKFGAADCLIILKVTLAGRRQVAFVGASSLAEGLLKAENLAKSDKLVWKEDQYAGPG